jgi:broad specificity phosphatase PhoE
LVLKSPNEVLARTTQLVFELDREYENSAILLVAHGDTLQILSTAFQGVPVSEHRVQVEKLLTAKVRRLQLARQKRHTLPSS